MDIIHPQNHSAFEQVTSFVKSLHFNIVIDFKAVVVISITISLLYTALRYNSSNIPNQWVINQSMHCIFNQNLPYTHLIYGLIVLIVIISFDTFIYYLLLSFLFAITVLIYLFVNLINTVISVLLGHFDNLLILFNIL